MALVWRQQRHAQRLADDVGMAALCRNEKQDCGQGEGDRSEDDSAFHAASMARINSMRDIEQKGFAAS